MELKNHSERQVVVDFEKRRGKACCRRSWSRRWWRESSRRGLPRGGSASGGGVVAAHASLEGSEAALGIRASRGGGDGPGLGAEDQKLLGPAHGRVQEGALEHGAVVGKAQRHHHGGVLGPLSLVHLPAGRVVVVEGFFIRGGGGGLQKRGAAEGKG